MRPARDCGATIAMPSGLTRYAAFRCKPACAISASQGKACNGRTRSEQFFCRSFVALPYTWTCQSDGGERREVIGFPDLHPGQPVAAVDGTGASFAQRARAVIDVGLRDRAKQKPSHGSERKKQRQERRSEVESHKPRDGSAAGHGRERLIGGFDEFLGKGDALGLIAIKNKCSGPALK